MVFKNRRRISRALAVLLVALSAQADPRPTPGQKQVCAARAIQLAPKLRRL